MEQEEKDLKTNQQQEMKSDSAEQSAMNGGLQENNTADVATESEQGHSRRNRRRRADRNADELTSKVEEMGKKMAEINEKYLRVYSEYENYRKRTSMEKAGLILNGGKDVIKLMLPILDDMERALANLSDDDSAKEGMQLIHKNMLNALQQKGLKPMEAMGAKFDENFHEAITQIPAPTPETKGTVLDVVKKGYFLNDEVLRFAQVVVGC